MNITPTIDEVVLVLPEDPKELMQAWLYWASPLSKDTFDDAMFGLLARGWAEYRHGKGLRVDVDIEVDFVGVVPGPPAFRVSTDNFEKARPREAA